MRLETAVRTLSSVVSCLALLAGCAPRSPVERVAEARSFYTATLNGFYATPVAPEPAVDETEMAPEGEEAPAEEAVATEAGGAPAAAAVEEAMAAPAGPALSDLVLDVVVRHDSPTRLDGLTLDVSLVDASQSEREHWLWWVDTSKLLKGDQAQFTRTFEGVEYEEGYGLSVEVRHPVPDAERGDYREFDVAE